MAVRANLVKMNAQEAREYLAAMAVQQIEYYFSVDNLCRDTYLRAHLDEEGWVPLALICNFPTVASFAADYGEIIKTLKESSMILEWDDENETIRLKEGAKNWLIPNMHGGMGCARWLCVKEKEVEVEEEVGVEGESVEGPVSVSVSTPTHSKKEKASSLAPGTVSPTASTTSQPNTDTEEDEGDKEEEATTDSSSSSSSSTSSSSSSSSGKKSNKKGGDKAKNQEVNDDDVNGTSSPATTLEKEKEREAPTTTVSSNS